MKDKLEICFKIADKSDIKKLAILSSKMWNHSLKELEDSYIEIINDAENNIIILALLGKEVIGFSHSSLRHDYVEGTNNSPVGYLEGVFVDENYRQRNIATDLINKGIVWAKEKGCEEIASDCELDNVSSYKFHLHVGFKETNRIICFTKKI